MDVFPLLLMALPLFGGLVVLLVFRRRKRKLTVQARRLGFTLPVAGDSAFIEGLADFPFFIGSGWEKRRPTTKVRNLMMKPGSDEITVFDFYRSSSSAGEGGNRSQSIESMLLFRSPQLALPEFATLPILSTGSALMDGLISKMKVPFTYAHEVNLGSPLSEYYKLTTNDTDKTRALFAQSGLTDFLVSDLEHCRNKTKKFREHLLCIEGKGNEVVVGTVSGRVSPDRLSEHIARGNRVFELLVQP